MVIKATGMNNRFKFLQQQIRLHRRREMSNPTIKYISENKMRKDKPLANEMLKHLEACEEIFKMDIARMGGTLSAGESQAEREYTTNLRYLTTFTLIGIFEKLSNINDSILALAEER